MWTIKPRAKTGTNGSTKPEPIKAQAALYRSSEINAVKLIAACNARKTSKNKPLRLIITFLPIDEERKANIVVFSRIRAVKFEGY